MPKRYSAREIVKALEKLQFVIISQRGSHIKMRGMRDGKLQTVIIPNHRSVAAGTFGSILRQASVTKSEIEEVI